MNTDRIQELLKKYRVPSGGEFGGVNMLRGLKDLCDMFIKPDFMGVEIGSFIGVSSELIAQYCKSLFCVDIWLHYFEIPNSDMDNAEAEFDAMVSNYTHIHKIKKRSVEASQDFENESLDFIYVDGSHEYQDVKDDLLAWIPKVKKGGYICGHDFTNTGVNKAIGETLDKSKITTFSDTSWAVLKD